ncbi:hypothetical protein H8709_07930 [Oscillospiraceae bacterium NSJ-54]|uniref:Uncharacterized protein n=1 Tax=Zongyangia hominis TaxID=2763677 RepID=A0A926EE50_9FIRM|nr:hypothetical protein [Zongyangia hominis]
MSKEYITEDPFSYLFLRKAGTKYPGAGNLGGKRHKVAYDEREIFVHVRQKRTK